MVSWYEYGFMSKCAEHGIGPRQAGRMFKMAQGAAEPFDADLEKSLMSASGSFYQPPAPEPSSPPTAQAYNAMAGMTGLPPNQRQPSGQSVSHPSQPAASATSPAAVTATAPATTATAAQPSQTAAPAQPNGGGQLPQGLSPKQMAQYNSWNGKSAREQYELLQRATPEQKQLLKQWTSQERQKELRDLHAQARQQREYDGYRQRTGAYHPDDPRRKGNGLNMYGQKKQPAPSPTQVAQSGSPSGSLPGWTQQDEQSFRQLGEEFARNMDPGKDMYYRDPGTGKTMPLADWYKQLGDTSKWTPDQKRQFIAQNADFHSGARSYLNRSVAQGGGSKPARPTGGV